MTVHLHNGLGRLIAEDPNDHRFPMAAVLEPVADVPLPDYKYWQPNGFLDQGDTGTCVAHAWYSLWMGSPHRHKADPDLTPFDVYRRIVTLDEWTENDHEATAAIEALLFGSSIRAGAKASQALGWIEGSYTWAWDVETAIRHVALVGPVVMGTWWTSGMDTPDKHGFVRYTGTRRGGHGYVWDGVNRKRGIARYRQSWKGWRYFYMLLEDTERLMADDGDCCAPTEIRVA